MEALERSSPRSSGSSGSSPTPTAACACSTPGSTRRSPAPSSCRCRPSDASTSAGSAATSTTWSTRWRPSGRPSRRRAATDPAKARARRWRAPRDRRPSHLGGRGQRRAAARTDQLAARLDPGRGRDPPVADRRPGPRGGDRRVPGRRAPRPTRSRPRCASRTCSRTCSARACSRRRSSRSTPSCSTRTGARPGELAGAVAGLLVALTGVLVVVGRPARPAADRAPRPGLQRRAPRPGRRPAPDHVPGHRVPGAVGVVPRHPQQPPPVLPVLRGAGAVEHRADRHRRRRRAATGPAEAGHRHRAGLGRARRRRRSSSWCSCRRCAALVRGHAPVARPPLARGARRHPAVQRRSWWAGASSSS